MCRHLGYLGGRAVALAELVLTPPHSLLVQSYQPRELLRGCVCADGAGVGWYAEDDPEPATYRRDGPIWADPDLPAVGRVVRSRCAVASVRNGTPGVAGGLASVQPFRHGAYLFSHNGAVAGFAERARALRDLLPDDLHAALAGASDSETLFLLAVARVREAGGDLAAGLRAALAEVAERAPGSGLNCLMTDGRTMAASRAAAGGRADSLYLLVDGARYPEGTVIASEPLDDDPGWEPVPEGRIVLVEGRRQPTLEPVA